MEEGTLFIIFVTILAGSGLVGLITTWLVRRAAKVVPQNDCKDGDKK